MTASDTKSDKVSQRMTVSGTTNENEQYAYFQYNILGFNIQESLHLFCYHFCQNLLKHVNIVVKSELLSGNNILIKSSGIPQKEN